jgi:hypothetical protein
MDFKDAIPMVSIAGFATQRSLEVLDPIFIKLSKKQSLNFFDDEKTAKGWWMTVAGFVIGLIFALSAGGVSLPGLGEKTSIVIIALAISMGSNATNSLVKFGEHVKEARKKEVEPLPEVKVTPASVTVTPNSTIKFLASVSVTDNKKVKWRVLEVTDGGTISTNGDGSGEYRAPATPGTYHVAAISEANEAATATATITVR